MTAQTVALDAVHVVQPDVQADLVSDPAQKVMLFTETSFFLQLLLLL